MIDNLIKELADYNRIEKQEDLLLERLRTIAEGVGAIQYGDQSSHGSARQDRMERAAIKLTEAKNAIAVKRLRRFEVRSDTCEYFYDRLDPKSAWIMEFYCIHGLTIREIADKIGRSYGYVNNVISKSKSTLEKYLKGDINTRK